jgi:hypothetical protein
LTMVISLPSPHLAAKPLFHRAFLVEAVFPGFAGGGDECQLLPVLRILDHPLDIDVLGRKVSISKIFIGGSLNRSAFCMRRDKAMPVSWASPCIRF